MPSIMEIRIDSPMSSRPCRFCLALQNDSVFADFDLDAEVQVYLVRISFDGYGCCTPDWRNGPTRIGISDSNKLLEYVDSGAHEVDITDILSNYFKNCGDALWIDALHDHQLIKMS